MLQEYDRLLQDVRSYLDAPATEDVYISAAVINRLIELENDLRRAGLQPPTLADMLRPQAA